MKRRTVSVLIIAIGLGALAVLFLPQALQKRLILRTCFHDAGGLRTNAPIRVAGVDVGLVSSIHARPTQKDCPAEAEFVLSTRDELLIPNDALARSKRQAEWERRLLRSKWPARWVLLSLIMA